MAPKVFASRFKLLRMLPSSGQSEIWVARDMDSEVDELIVVKILAGSGEGLLREFFVRETEALSQLHHHGIVKILDWGFAPDEGRYWLALEHLEGITLQKWVEGPENTDDAPIEVMLEVIDSISVAHAKGIIHRDLKPTNIFCESTGEIKILDFGICKIKALLQEGMTVGGFGTPPYTAPEQVMGLDVDYCTDVYSLGVILFYLLTKTDPKEVDVRTQVKSANLPEEIKALILNMIHGDMTKRPSSVLHVKRELMKYYKANKKKRSTYCVKVTQKLCNAMADLALIEYNTEDEAIAWLDSQLNSSVIYLEKRQGNWLLYTHQHRIAAVYDHTKSELLLKDINRTSSVDMARDKEWSYPCETSWKALRRNSVQSAGLDISELLDKAEIHKQKMEIRRNRDKENKKTIEQWESILRLQKRFLLEKDFALPYSTWDVSSDSSYIEVRLDREQEELSLFVDQPLLMDSVINKRKISVGTFASVEGKKLTITLARGVDTNDIKEFGEITLDNRQVSAALKRQEDAIRAVRYGDSVNPNLLELIEKPNLGSTSSKLIPIDQYFQDDLDDAKREAVRATLTSDIYLIQGPPGTGKTKVIGEIIAQLINYNPNMRILLTSQSNAAVDNALEAASRLVNDTTFLRIGRKEKIGERLTEYQIENALGQWIGVTRSRSDCYSRQLHSENNSELVELAEYKSRLSEVLSYYDDLKYIDEELSKVRYRLYEESNQEKVNESICKTLAKKAEELEQDKFESFDLIKTNMESLSSSLKLKKPDLSINLEEIRSSILTLDKHIDQKRMQLSQLEQIELIRQEWLKRLGRGREFEAICASETQVVASTCLGVSNIPGVWASEYDWVIVDEAGRATPPEILVPLVRGRRVLLVGDHKQLPPVVDISISQEDLIKYELDSQVLEKSLFEDIFNRADDRIRSVLDVQYRMHTGIGSLVSEVFYNGTLRNAVTTADLDHQLSTWPKKSVVWISTSTREGRFETAIGKSKQNELEARLISEYCEKIEAELRGTNRSLTMGVISGYAQQKALLEQLISPKDSHKWRFLEIEIDNIDAFQGQEREAVIYSIVRSNKKNDIGFLKDYRRLNVALSRARKLLVIFGDHEMAMAANTHENSNPFSQVIRHIQKVDSKNCLLEVN